MPPTLPGRSVGAPGNVQARGLNPAQPSDQRYASADGKFPARMWFFIPQPGQEVSQLEEKMAKGRKTGRRSSFAILRSMLPRGSTERDGGLALAHNQNSRDDEPCSFDVDSVQKLVVVRFGKTVTARDIERYAARLRENPAFQPLFSEITDLRDVEELDLKADEFLRLADEVDPFSDQSKRAFVVRNAVQAHAARMHKILRTHKSFEIFQSLEDAERWIFSPVPTPRPANAGAWLPRRQH